MTQYQARCILAGIGAGALGLVLRHAWQGHPAAVSVLVCVGVAGALLGLSFLLTKAFPGAMRTLAPPPLPYEYAMRMELMRERGESERRAREASQ